MPSPVEIKDKSASLYDDLRNFAGYDFEIIFGALSMIVACAQSDMRLTNPEIPIEEIQRAFNERVAEIGCIMEADLPNIMGRH